MIFFVTIISMRATSSKRGKNEFRNNNFGGVLWAARSSRTEHSSSAVTKVSANSSFRRVVRVPDAADIAAARAVNAVGGPPENPLSTRFCNSSPAESGGDTGNNYSFAAPNTNNSDNFLVRSIIASTTVNLSGRYVFGDGNQTFPLTSGNGSPLPAYQTVVPTRIQLFGLNLSQVLTRS